MMDNNQKIRITGYRQLPWGNGGPIYPHFGETTWGELSKVMTENERLVALNKFEKGETVSFSWGFACGQINYDLIFQEEMIST